MAVSKYPWDKWADGAVHALAMPDEPDDVQRFRNTVYVYAKRNGMFVRTKVKPLEDGERVAVMFQLRPAEEGDSGFSSVFSFMADSDLEEVEVSADGTLALA